MCGRQALVVANEKASAVFNRGSLHLFAVLERNGHGLFAEDVLAVIERVDRDRRVIRIGNANADQVDFRIGNDLLGGFIHLAAKVGRHRFRARTGKVEYGGDLRIGISQIFCRVALTCNGTAANNSCFQHSRVSPVFRIRYVSSYLFCAVVSR
ncbi:hypothetical protein SDC9_146600 [bioreactor metagenome]|uniref:Uncharacterized protein n=1 Tax=bioreactor metagenome TaxID=1076179 RepID=A0A645EDI6_9ZZZZ